MTYINEDIIKKVRESNDIVEVISSYLPLVQKGKNYFAVCPFHDDHTPSMSISPEKQIFRCFVCGTSGNVITFIEDYLKVSFTEAIKILGNNIGLNININEEKKDSPYKEFYDIYKVALSYYKNNLNSKDAAKAREYLLKRNLDKETIDYFDIGLSLNGGLCESLSKKHDYSLLKKIGLSNSSGNDLFRNRIMFPIKDNDGNIVGFSARKYVENDEAKYINTSETEVFKKGEILYNYYKAKDIIRKKHEIIICEGQMEIIRLHTIGVDNAVALMGTSFTPHHLEIIKNLKSEVILNLDQDDAGKIATIAIGDLLIKNDISPKVIIFTGYKDADELISNKGKDEFLNAYKNRINFIDFKLNYLKRNKDLNNSSEISEYIKKAIEAINLIDDDILRELKIKELSKEFDISEDLIKSKITNNNKKEVIQKKQVIEKNIYNKYDKSEIRILFLMLNNEELIKYYINNLGYLNNPKRKKLADEIINYYIKNKTFDLSDFICYTTMHKELNEVMKEVNAFKQSEDYTNEELEDYITRVKEKKVKMQIDFLADKMKNTLDVEEKKRLATRIEKMKKEVLKW